MAGNNVAVSNAAGAHGTFTDFIGKRVKYNYCSHEMSSLHRLKLHLASITGDVRPCPIAPETVKQQMKNDLMSESNNNIAKRRARGPDGANINAASQERARKRLLRPNDNGNDDNRASEVEINAVELASQHIQGSGILEQPGNEEREIRRYVREVRESWDETGCSILTDIWISEDGQKLVQFVVDSLRGPVYLQSHDITDNPEKQVEKKEAKVVLSLLDRLVTEIGAENVVQIVGSSNLWDMWSFRNIIEERNSAVFSTFSSSHCLELMIKRMEELSLFGGVEQIMRKTKAIIDFFFKCDDAIFEQLQDYHILKDLLMRPVKFTQAKPYMMLKVLVSQKRTLKLITTSAEWRASSFAQSKEGCEVWEIIRCDLGFWAGAKDVLKLTLPMINVLYSMDTSPLPQMGFIYKMIDDMKSQLQEAFKGRESEYNDISQIIDEVWNKDLHSDLHCAAYFLNPCLGQIDMDDEVMDGFLNCITRMIPRVRDQRHVLTEAQDWRKEGQLSETFTGSSPVDWWICHKAEFHIELSRMAIRILSQTCDGVSRYQLERAPAEHMLASSRKPYERRALSHAAFIRYNKHLKRFKNRLEDGVNIEEVERE